MTRILMILALCSLATAPNAETELTPAKFDLLGQFNRCLGSGAANYQNCQSALEYSFTLRREIGKALQACVGNAGAGCVTSFNAAGFPADRLNIAALDHCTLLDDLTLIYITYMPEGSCIEQIAEMVERNSIPTQHDTGVFCDRTYVACLEMVGMGAEYWQNAGWILLLDKQKAVIASDEFETETKYRQYNLLERQHRLQIELAQTRCNLQIIGQRRNASRDYEVCLGTAYAGLWADLRTTENAEMHND